MLIMIFPPFHDYHLLSRLIMIFPPFHDYHHDLLPRHYIMIFSPLHNHHHDLLPRLIMIFSPLHNHQQRSSPQAFLLQSISNPTKLIPMGDPEDPTGILYTKKYQCFEMFWNVLKCFEMLWNALKCFKVMVSKPTRSFFTSSQGSVDHGSRFPTYYHGGRTQEANEKDAWTGSLIFIVYLSKFQHPKYCKLLTIIKKSNFRIPFEVFGHFLCLLSFEYFINRM